MKPNSFTSKLKFIHESQVIIARDNSFLESFKFYFIQDTNCKFYQKNAYKNIQNAVLFQYI
jgi:hypothetical protein